MTLAELTISNISKSVNEIEQAHLIKKAISVKHSKLFGKIKKRKEKTITRCIGREEARSATDAPLPLVTRAVVCRRPFRVVARRVRTTTQTQVPEK